MPDIFPTVEFFAGLSEELSNVSLRRGKESGDRQVVLTFQKLKAITINPSSVKFLFGGDDGDELRGAQCGFEINDAEHWERFMRFMKRYAEANGMDYQDR